MYQTAHIIVIAALTAFSSALPQSSQSGGELQGLGTFNNYGAQNTKNCDGLFEGKDTKELAQNDANKIYQAALSDVSKGLGEYKCDYTERDSRHDPDQCTDEVGGTTFRLPNHGSYIAPRCPGAPCGKCYTVTNKANQKRITVQVVDACPKDTAWNYCKALATNPEHNIPASGRCADPNTNNVDMDLSAYPALTGQSYQSVSVFMFSPLLLFLDGSG
ncbi:MAG: hypothetical protein Q9185_002860 [Variospora sp. 1 TL-2023]